MAPDIQTAFHEKHYSVFELATIWNVSDDFIRRRFQKEPGVIRISNLRPGRRAYTTLRIPESVALRVYRTMVR